VLSLQAWQHRPFGQIAVELGFLSEQGLADLLRAQNQRNQSLGDILVNMGVIDRPTLEAEQVRAALPSYSDYPS
jgi:hypothetical protein